MGTKVFLGIDVSKGYADFILLDQDKKVLEENFRLDDNTTGRKRLLEIITGWLEGNVKELYCGVESTGGYENNWYYLLKNLFKHQQVHVARLNPKGVKSLGEAALTRTVTDAVSARNIALYLISFPDKVDYGKAGKEINLKFKEGRQHSTYIRMLTKQKVQLNNQLEKLIYQYFSEVIVYCRNGTPGWLLRLLTKHSCASAICKAGAAKLQSIKGISAEKAAALIKKATGSDKIVSKEIQHLISVTSREILHKQELIVEEKQYLSEIYKDCEEVKLLETIPGIAIDTAVTVMLEIEDIDRFESSKKLAAFFGVHPTFKESGDGLWAAKMSKKGRGELRAVLYMSALTSLRWNPSLKQMYARFRAKGMKHYQAIGVIMHKLLRLIYGVLHNKQHFNQQIDDKNIKRSKEKQEKKENETKENIKIKEEKRNRYQGNQEAPISRRATQKRKKQTAS